MNISEANEIVHICTTKGYTNIDNVKKLNQEERKFILEAIKTYNSAENLNKASWESDSPSGIENHTRKYIIMKRSLENKASYQLDKPGRFHFLTQLIKGIGNLLHLRIGSQRVVKEINKLSLKTDMS